MIAFGQAGFGSRNRQNQLRSQGQVDPFGQQVRQAMQPPTLNIYQAPPATAQAQAGGTAQPAPTVNMTAQTGGMAQTAPAGPQQRDWAGNTVSRMPPELAAQWQSMQSGQGGLGAANITPPDSNAGSGNVVVGYGVGGDGVTMQPIYGPDPGRLTKQTFTAQTGGGLVVGPDGRLTPGMAQPIQPQSQGTPYGKWAASMQGAWQQGAQDQELKRTGRDQLGMKPPTLSPGDMSISDWQSQRSGMDTAYLQQVRDEMSRRGMQRPQVQLPVGMVIDGNGNWSPDWARLQQEQDDEMRRWLSGDQSAAKPWS